MKRSASLRLVTGDAAEAEAAYRRALAIVPESPDALIGLAAALADGGNAGRGGAHARARDRGAAALRGVAHGVRQLPVPAGARARGDRAYQRATSLEPDNPGAFNNLGGAYLYVGDFDQAAEAFSRSLAIEPRRASYSNTGTGLYYRGRFGEAAEMFRKAIEARARRPPPVGQPRRRAAVRRPARRRPRRPTPAHWNWPRGSSRSTRSMASTRRRRRTMRLGSGTGTGPGSASRTPWPTGKATMKCTTTWGWPSWGSGDQAGAVGPRAARARTGLSRSRS